MKDKTFFSRSLRKNQTDVERLLWSKLRNRKLKNNKFHRQYVMGKYILDFITFDSKLVIELDGGQHNKEENKQKDYLRDTFLKSQGFQVLRFWNNDVLNHMQNVLEAIYIRLSFPSSQPSPNREKEVKE